MNVELHYLINAAQKLSPRKKLDLIHAVSQSLPTLPKVGDTDFWTVRSLEEHLQRQKTPVITDIAELRADFWPEEETADDLIAYIYTQKVQLSF